MLIIVRFLPSGRTWLIYPWMLIGVVSSRSIGIRNARITLRRPSLLLTLGVTRLGLWCSWLMTDIVVQRIQTKVSRETPRIHMVVFIRTDVGCIGR